LAQLGQLDEARVEAKLFMAQNPHFRISYWVETQPFRDWQPIHQNVWRFGDMGISAPMAD